MVVLTSAVGTGVTGVVVGVILFLHDNWIHAVKKIRRIDLYFMANVSLVAIYTKRAVIVS